MKLLEIIKSLFKVAKGTYSNSYAMNLSYEDLNKSIKSLSKVRGKNILVPNNPDNIVWAKAHRKFLSKKFPEWFTEGLEE